MRYFLQQDLHIGVAITVQVDLHQGIGRRHQTRSWRRGAIEGGAVSEGSHVVHPMWLISILSPSPIKVGDSIPVTTAHAGVRSVGPHKGVRTGSTSEVSIRKLKPLMGILYLKDRYSSTRFLLAGLRSRLKL